MIATDDAVLADLLDLRKAGLPGWHRIYTADQLVQLRMADPNHIHRWLDALGSKAEVVREEFAAEGVDFHHADVCDWRPGWTVYLACRVGRSGSGVLDEVPAHARANDGGRGDWS